MNTTTQFRTSKILRPDEATIPEEIKKVPQWVLWRLTRQDGRFAKVPYQPNRKPADVNDGSTWCTFAEVWSAYEGDGEAFFSGIGFVITEETEYAGLDFDGVFDRETGMLNEELADEIDEFQSYAELSPSGTGAHVWIKIRDKKRLRTSYKREGREFYTGRRFLTVTGHSFNDPPLPIAERQEKAEAFVREHFTVASQSADAVSEVDETLASLPADLEDEDKALIQRALRAPSHSKFRVLWEGDLQRAKKNHKYHSRSEIRYALLSILAYRTGGDSERTRRLYLASGFYAKATKGNRGKDDRLLESEIQKITAGPSHGPAEGAASRMHIQRRFMTARELLDMDIPEVRVIVPGLLAAGLNILAGAPKAGKTRLSTRIALAVAGGDAVLGREPQTPMKVLFYALEDSDSRMQSRLKEFGAQGLAVDNLLLNFATPGKEGLERAIKETPDLGLVIIDTLSQFHLPSSVTPSYKEDYGNTSWLAKLARDYRIAILVLHHTRKGVTGDPIGDVSGTHGLTGGADTVIVLSRPQARGLSVLKVRSRDFDEADLLLDDNDPKLVEAPAAPSSPVRTAIMSVLSPTQPPLSPSEILDRFPGSLYSLANVKYHLKQLTRAKAILPAGYGHYASCSWVTAHPAGETSPSPALKLVSNPQATSPQVGVAPSPNSTTPTSTTTTSSSSSFPNFSDSSDSPASLDSPPPCGNGDSGPMEKEEEKGEEGEEGQTVPPRIDRGPADGEAGDGTRTGVPSYRKVKISKRSVTEN